MLRSDFIYHLPDAQIAQAPLPERSSSRLLVLRPDEGVHDGTITDLCGLVRPDDLVVLNDTRVMQARLIGQRTTGGRVEFLVERVLDVRRALAHGRASKPLRVDNRVDVSGVSLVVRGRQGALYEIEVAGDETMESLMASRGQVPLPPYIRRNPDAADLERYQTVYAQVPGAVAAPTAGLHFDPALLEALRARGVVLGRLTLHVGAGTFQPLREEELDRHVMHAERYRIGPELIAQVAQARAAGGRVIAIGTTVVRALESAAAEGDLRVGESETQLFIRPGYAFRVVDAMLTNFHLPASTLLMLVCAFGGYERVMAAYRHAVASGYRFFSYGDAMWLERAG